MMAQRLSCAGAMDFPRAPYEAMQEQQPRWDFRNWDYRTILAQTPDERDAIHQYQVDPQRRAWAKVAAAQHQRDTADINAQLEAAAGRRGPQTQASNALPSSRAPLVAARESSRKTAKLSLHSPQLKQMSNNREDKREGQGTWVQDEDQALVIVDECRFGEQQEQQVVVVQEPRSGESLSSPPPLWIDEPDRWLDRVSPPTPPPPPPRKEDGDMEEQAPPPPPRLPRPPGMSLPVDDGGFRGRKVGDSDRDVGVLFLL